MDLKYSDAVDKHKRKSSETMKQLLSSDEYTHRVGCAVLRLITVCAVVPEAVLSHASNLTRKEVQIYNKALKELIVAVSNPLDQFECGFHGSDALKREHMPCHLEETHHLSTETDVTLPSCVDGSQDSEPQAGNTLNRSAGRLKLLSSTCQTSPSDLDKVCQEMMTIYERLQAERASHQEWERELMEREGRLEERERRVEEGERRVEERSEALGRLSGMEEALNSCILSVQERHQREVLKLQELLKERTGEIKRMSSSFNVMKKLNNSMKEQLKELGEQNTKLESHYKRVQGRLENLQRKYDPGMVEKARLNVCAKATQSRREKSGASSKPTNKAPMRPSSPSLLALLLDWLLETQTFSLVAPHHETASDPQCLPPQVLLTDRCLQMLPLLADQLQRTSLSDPPLLLCVLRLVYWGLRHLDSSPQRGALSSTLRRIGAQVSAHPPEEKDSGDGVLPGSRGNSGPAHGGSVLYHSPCPHTRVLSALIVLHTVTQADLLAQALGGLRSQLRSEGSRGLFLQYGGLGVLLRLLGASSRGGLHGPVDILMQLSAPSRFLDPFLDACSCADFFSTISKLLQQPPLDLRLLEKLSILLQKLSNIRRNRRLFERSSLRLLLQEMQRTTEPSCSFLRLNLGSILLNLT
ncbi:coiled-coil domain-containing protein 138-like isoform X1 [Gadus chalcogrammus]|uniref:coiled-coil domain-containing protein 138-like isoform X1 n=1 Tax=Gadus chalcogrammus TaxID=1042646 RepID=UPI0024C47CC3|nr:coiled-coil domain-containing protein 138-like isoform X1 [Gadus chalcogrammus]